MASRPLEQVLDLLSPGRRPAEPPIVDGYLDLLGADDPIGAGAGQRLMGSRLLPLVYERAWRPLGARVLMGAFAPSPAAERRLALEMLALEPGDRVLDVACGPGNFTRAFAGTAGAGLVVGVDASRTMLAQAAREPAAGAVAYVRADAADLPFADASFEAICCFAALYLIDDPFGALDEIARVIAPGGRAAFMTSVNRGLLPARATDLVVRGLSGVRIFRREELTDALAERGLAVESVRVSGFAQFVAARRPR
jgi:SAM-dependent methyltransferase